MAIRKCRKRLQPLWGWRRLGLLHCIDLENPKMFSSAGSVFFFIPHNTPHDQSEKNEWVHMKPLLVLSTPSY